MMTAISKAQSMIIILLFFSVSAFSQKVDNKVFLLFEEKMKTVKENDGIYTLNFTVFDKGKYQSDSYIFYYDNYIGFERVEIEKTKKKITIDTSINIKKLEELKALDPCELHNYFNEHKIYLIKNESGDYYIYPLLYFATTKWEKVN